MKFSSLLKSVSILKPWAEEGNKKTMFKTIVQYFSPLTQDEKYEQGVYSKNSQMTDESILIMSEFRG